MDYQKLSDTIIENGTQLVTLGGKIHPYAGAAVALLIVIASIWLGFKVKSQVWQKLKQKSGELLAGTGSDQAAADKTQKTGDDFLDKEED